MNGVLMSPGGIGAVDPRAGWRSSSCSSSSSTSVCSKFKRLVGQLHSFDSVPLVNFFFGHFGFSVSCFFIFMIHRRITSSNLYYKFSRRTKSFLRCIQVYSPPYTTYDVYVTTPAFRKSEKIPLDPDTWASTHHPRNSYASVVARDEIWRFAPVDKRH